MIDELQVSNIALIREATLVPSAGLTVLTGETGAGKTALLSALKLFWVSARIRRRCARARRSRRRGTTFRRAARHGGFYRAAQPFCRGPQPREELTGASPACASFRSASA
ncbi:MAG: AAA family ATPase [Collinsella sp.]